MSDTYIEKIFLYLLIFSLLLHAGVIALVVMLPQERKPVEQSPYMVDLRDLPVPPEPPATKILPKTKRAEPVLPNPVPQAKPLSRPAAPTAPLMPAPMGSTEETKRGGETARKATPAERPQGESIVRRKKEGGQAGPDLAKLFPSAQRLAKIEDSYRSKYEEKTGGDKLFLDKDNDLLGSYSRRFLEAVRGRWKLVGRQLIMNNETGYGLLLITINRNGIVDDVHVVESSGNKRVDEEIIRTVRTAGYVGPLPKKWPYDKVQGYYVYSAGYEIVY
ncbi:MAG TPA: TonB family protein [Geobacteraceae bacterium]